MMIRRRLVISALVVSFLTIALSVTLSGCMPCRESKEHLSELQGPVAEQWVNIYDHKDKNIASQLTVDTSGNVYVSGTATTTKFNSEGKKLWTVKSGAYISVDEEGNFYTTVCSGDAYVTTKYNSNGKSMWSVASEVCPTALTVDNSGNVYVTGSSNTTIKYDSGGNKLWVAHYESNAISPDFPDAMAGDSSGNVYLIGLSVGAYTRSDYLTLKYDGDGKQLWVARYNGPASSYDSVKAIALDELGNVYVTGYSPGNGTGKDYATVKYSSDGNQLWVARYNGPANNDDEPCGIAVDTAGNVYVTGSSHGNYTQFQGGIDYATVKYDSEGKELWVARYSSPKEYWNQARAMAVDSSGNVYVTGLSQGDTTKVDIATVKYNSQGNQVWIARYIGKLNIVFPYHSYYDDESYAIALDAQGDVYVAGSTTTKVCIGGLDERHYQDYVLIKYTQ